MPLENFFHIVYKLSIAIIIINNDKKSIIYIWLVYIFCDFSNIKVLIVLLKNIIDRLHLETSSACWLNFLLFGKV